MNWLADNWFLVLVAIVIVAYIVAQVVQFYRMPSEEQQAKIKEWLKYAVSLAEKELGGGTGQLKLRSVYNMFVEKYPSIAKVVSFETFSGWVDEALVWMNKSIETNPNIAKVIKD